MSNRPPTGVFRRLRFLWRRFRCPHKRTFVFFPRPVWWERDGKANGRMLKGAKVICCMDCGELWGSNYAE